MADGLQEKQETINAFIQWQHTTSERTPEAYIQYLAREGALEKLETAINLIDDLVLMLNADHMEAEQKNQPLITEYIDTVLGVLYEMRTEAGL